jgi:hypothetical protein
MTRLRRVCLATVTPGPDLVRAFGHAALVFEDGTSASAGSLTAFSYGHYILPDVRPRFAAGLAGARESVAEAVFESLMPVLKGTLRAGKACESFAAFRSRVPSSQRLLLDELELDGEQLATLHRQVVADHARVEPGQREPGTYRYDHFESNCVTRLRDEIFRALGPEESNALFLRTDVDTSYAEIIEQTLRQAIQASGIGVVLFPPALEPFVRRFLPGAQAVTRDPAQFLVLLRGALAHVADTAPFASDIGKQTLTRVHALLDVEIPKRPRGFRQTLFTPLRLRDALARWTNPKTGRPVLSSGATLT